VRKKEGLKIGDLKMKDKTVCIVGLGYVGLPLAKAFSKHLKTIGFDIDNEKIRRLKRDEDNLEFTTDPSKIKQIEKDERRIRGHALAITHHP
jgi:UDP-N-acetyl-D-mannosaminuronate dehydrogenase